MSTQIKEITGREVLKIQALAGEFPYNVAKESPMHGKKYRRFALLGQVFVANTEDSFCTEFDKGQLYSVNVMESVDPEDATRKVLSLVGKTNITQETNMAKAEATLERIAVSAKIPNLTEAQLAALEEEIV